MRNLPRASRTARYVSIALGLGVIAAGAVAVAPVSAATGAHAALHPFTVSSPNFRDDGRLPVSAELGGPDAGASGCNGQNMAPTLRWTNAPASTMGFAFTMNDVDAPRAGGFHHWVVYNIPAGVHQLAGHGQNPFTEGTNSFGQTHYDGPAADRPGAPLHLHRVRAVRGAGARRGPHVRAAPPGDRARRGRRHQRDRHLPAAARRLIRARAIVLAHDLVASLQPDPKTRAGLRPLHELPL